MKDENTATSPTGSPAVPGSAKRGIVCCFCGEAWGYEGDNPTDALLKAAVDHEAECPRNPYISEINTLRNALREIHAEASTTWDATKPPADMGKICKLADAALSQSNPAHPAPEAKIP